MKKISQFVIATLIIGIYTNIAFAQQNKIDLLQGYWRSNTGNLIKIEGEKGILVETTAEPWRKYIDKPIIKDIQKRHNKWEVKELIRVNEDFVWVDLSWELEKNRIIKELTYLKSEEQNYYERIELSEKEKKAYSTPIKSDEKESPKTLSKARHTWEIGPEISIIEYKEPDVMSQKGTMYGIGAAYNYHNGVMIKVAGRYSYGQVDYQNSGTLDNIDDIIFEIRTLGGYDFKISSSFTMTPFIGLGYRYLKDDMAGQISSSGAKGYLRESNYYYSPIGIEAVNVFDKGWSAGVILEYDYFWEGMQKSYLSDVSAGLNDIENHQNSGYGARGSIIIKKQTDRIFYIIEPFIRYWNIDKSEVQNVTYFGSYTGVVGYEPKNESTEIGVKFMIGF